MEVSDGNDLDDVTNIQSAVLMALSKLTKRRKSAKKAKKFNGVSCKSIVEYLKANYSWIDGDVESQVMTALLSCIKTGLVCALVSGRYRLIGPSAKAMATNCILRPSHGPKCSCLNMLKCFSKSFSQICCFIETKDSTTKRKRMCTRKKNLAAARSATLTRNKRRIGCGKARIGCVRSAEGFDAGPTQSSLENSFMTTRSLCRTCFPQGQTEGTRYDGFSQRDGDSSQKCYPLRSQMKKLPPRLALA